LFYMEPKLMVVIDIDPPPDGVDAPEWGHDAP
jgi:hypothetical protein